MSDLSGRHRIKVRQQVGKVPYLLEGKVSNIVFLKYRADDQIFQVLDPRNFLNICGSVQLELKPLQVWKSKQNEINSLSTDEIGFNVQLADSVMFRE